MVNHLYYRCRMTCLSLCHGTPHEQTSLHSVTIPLPDEFDEGAVHILGDWITVSSINTKQATIEWKSDTVNVRSCRSSRLIPYKESSLVCVRPAWLHDQRKLLPCSQTPRNGNVIT